MHARVVFPVWIILAPILLIGAVTAFMALFAPKGEPPPDDAWDGVFYSNRDDRALLVPKRVGIGYTLNFGNPWSWVVLVVILLGAAAPFFLIAFVTGRLPR